MLTISPEGGMCNRLLALHSAIELARAWGRPLRVIWYQNNNFGAGLTDIFEMPSDVADYHAFDIRRRTLSQSLAELQLRYLRWPFIHPDFGCRDIEAIILADQPSALSRLDRIMASKKHVFIKSWSLFYGKDRRLQDFQPLPSIRQQVAEITSAFRNTIGVHLRRGDHKPATTYSTTDLFERRMRELLAADPSVDFFVASDSPTEINYLKTQFPGKIRSSSPSSFSRNERQGIEAAAVDLYSLAATRRILGSFSSTFSQVAGKLGEVEVEYILDDEDPVLNW